MKRQLFISLLFLISVTMLAQSSNNKYEKDWTQVEQYETGSLPQSAAKLVDDILKKAIAEKNNTQVIKSLIYKNKYKQLIDNQDREGLYTDLQELIAKTNDVSEKSLLHSMLAELFIEYYNKDRWNINNRTQLADVVPADMKEWSSNIFRDKIIENIDLSIKDKDTLKKQTTKAYSDIIELGADAQAYYPTLYDFLMYRAINVAQTMTNVGQEEFDFSATGVTLDQLSLPANEFAKLKIKSGAGNRYAVFNYFQQYIKDLLDRKMTSTLILEELDKLNFLKGKARNIDYKKQLEIYTRLEKLYDGNDTSIEIIDDIIKTLYREQNQIERNKQQYEWAQLGIRKYADSKRINILKNQLNNLERPSLRIIGNNIWSPDSITKLELFYKNTQALDKKLNLALYAIQKDNYIRKNELPVQLVSKTTYNEDSTFIEIGKLPNGKYCITDLNNEKNLKNSENDNNKLNFVVSRLLTFNRNSAKDEYEIFVVDRITGKPIKDAVVKIYSHNYAWDDNKISRSEPIITLKTNESGLAIYKDTAKKRERYEHFVAIYKVSIGDDTALAATPIYVGNYNYRNDTPQENNNPAISVFTDRSIYRPGQTAYFKAILLDSKSKPQVNKLVTAQLFNANNEEVSKKELKTNEYGSVAGDFILPQSGLLGSFYIKVDEGTNYFNVEEYKRPTFEVTFDKLDKTYTFGQEVKLKGFAKAFSGVSLQNANVQYTISRQPFSFWFWRSSNESHFADGTVQTKDDGSFEILFTPEAGEGNQQFFRGVNKQIYAFNITATVTDINGETQSNTYAVNVGEVSMIVNIDIPEQIEKSQDYKINIEAKNLQGEDIKTSGSYCLHLLDDNGEVLNKVMDGNFATGEQAGLKNRFKNIASGRYQICITALDDKGKEVSENKKFTIYSYDDKRPPIKTNAWLVNKNTAFSPIKPAEIIYGVSDKDVYVLYLVYNNSKIFERKYLKMSNENKLFTLPYLTEYGDQVYVSFTVVKDGKLTTNNILLEKESEKSDDKLIVKTEVFRDKLRPGQDETWTISIKDAKSHPAQAEVLASMYDISLDKLNPYLAWNLNRPYIYKEYLYPLNYNYSSSNEFDVQFNFDDKFKSLDVKPYYFDRINWFGYPVYSLQLSNASDQVEFSAGWGQTGIIRKANLRFKSYGVAIAGKGVDSRLSKEYDTLSDQVLTESAVLAAESPYDKADQNTPLPSAPQIRRNFNETAFFYPQLRTNDNGETLISFTAPESNTTWRFRALAHDKEAKVGQLEQMVTTRKELMVTPNMPRFVHQSDKTSISTKISNLSDKTVSGIVRIEFFDPITEKAIDLKIADQKQNFSLDKDASTSADWTFDVPNNIEMLGCRIVAQSEAFSDGEQHALAVLSNRMLVTESMPIDVTKSGSTTYTFDKLYNNKSASLDNYKLTLEFASNPAWYAVQALPTMSNPTNENAVSWFASYYVNTLGSSIMRQYPKVASMIEAWKKQGGDKETLVSKLQKNEELKAVLLEETPWVLDAKNETEQMQRLSVLFDLNNTKQLTDAATEKLSELITNDKGWSWCKGMYPSRSVTQYILYGYSKLQEIGKVEYNQRIKEMQMSALQFVDKQISDDFVSLKKNNKTWDKISDIATNQLEYLYIRSSYRDIPVSQETRAAERFYTSVVSKNWTKLNMYERSLLTVLLQRNGDKTVADQITKSIREHAVKSEKLGMYWPNNRSNVFSSLSAVSTHVFLMDALKKNGASDEEMDMMKRWLLKQKQTQSWESTHASLDAIGALLSTGSNWFTGEVSTTKVKVANKTIEPDTKELGTGYFKTTWSKSEISNNMGKVEVSQPNTQPAYGAMYWQYFENLDKITALSGDLNINKQLFKETISPAGKGLLQITENNPLTVGDKVVVRLTVRVDRDMEFIQLKDMRAACFEPLQTVSGTSWNNSVLYYQTVKDASTNFYFDHLPKGTYVFEYPVYVNRSGEYANGITTIQCLYAPEFVSHTQGIKVTVKEK